mgnify:CR=1 FL=1
MISGRKVDECSTLRDRLQVPAKIVPAVCGMKALVKHCSAVVCQSVSHGKLSSAYWRWGLLDWNQPAKQKQESEKDEEASQQESWLKAPKLNQIISSDVSSSIMVHAIALGHQQTMLHASL